MTKPALFIGRFQPFHLGHLDAIRQILRSHKKVIIGIGSTQKSGEIKNPFKAALRKKMIEASLRGAQISKKRFTIAEIPDINNDNAWVAHVEKLTPRFGVIYSGTEKVKRLFKKNGRHPVKTPLFNLKISATLIREKIKQKKEWRKLVPKQVMTIIHGH